MSDSNIAFLEGSRNAAGGALTVWVAIEAGRIVRILLTVFLRKTIMPSLAVRRPQFPLHVREGTIALRAHPALRKGQGFEYEV